MFTSDMNNTFTNSQSNNNSRNEFYIHDTLDDEDTENELDNNQ